MLKTSEFKILLSIMMMLALIIIGVELGKQFFKEIEPKEEIVTVSLSNGKTYKDVTIIRKNLISDWYIVNDTLVINKDNIVSIVPKQNK